VGFPSWKTLVSFITKKEGQMAENTNEKGAPENTPVESQVPSQEGSPEEALSADSGSLEAILKECECLRNECQSAKDSKLRLLAEFDNYKRRTARESIRQVETANEELIKELLPVLENFERAMDPAHKEKDMDAFYKGVEMIYTLFSDKLKKVGLVESNPIGEEFNVDLHEALMQVESEEFPENKITQVFQKGFMLNNKVIQYAKVAVSKGSAS